MNQPILARRPRSVIDGIPVEVRRSRRRRSRIGLAFDPAGFVIIEAPLDVSDGEIQDVVREHRRWLRHRLTRAADSGRLSALLRYETGEVLHFLGEPHQLVVERAAEPAVRLEPSPRAGGLRGNIRVTLDPVAADADGDTAVPVRVAELLRSWYRARAAEQFHLELDAWRRRLPWLEGRLPEWRQRFMRSQWGSCNRAGRISLNTHLIKTPARLIGYVALHELCHLQHYDHGHGFYALLGRYMPDWQQRRSELDRYLPVLLQD